MRSLGICFALLFLAAAPLYARGRDVSGHYERPGENDEASLDVKMLPGNRVKVTGIALWNTKNEKYGPNIGELDFETDLKDDTASWSDDDGYRIVIRFSRHALDVTEHGVGGHFGMNVTFGGHYVRTAAMRDLNARWRFDRSGGRSARCFKSSDPRIHHLSLLSSRGALFARQKAFSFLASRGLLNSACSDNAKHELRKCYVHRYRANRNTC